MIIIILIYFNYLNNSNNYKNSNIIYDDVKYDSVEYDNIKNTDISTIILPDEVDKKSKVAGKVIKIQMSSVKNNVKKEVIGKKDYSNFKSDNNDYKKLNDMNYDYENHNQEEPIQEYKNPIRKIFKI